MDYNDVSIRKSKTKKDLSIPLDQTIDGLSTKWCQDVPPEQEVSSTQAPLMATVISSGKLNVRESPDKLSDVLCVVNRGDVLIVADTDIHDGWAFVQTNSGFIGYVMREYIGPTWYE